MRRKLKQFSTRIDLLNDAIAYYWGKPERLCVNEHGYCQYHPSDTSEGCAIGRLLPEDIVDKLPSDSGVYDVKVWDYLPDWLKNMGQEFLKDLQILHDTGGFSQLRRDDVITRMGVHVDVDAIIFPD